MTSLRPRSKWNTFLCAARMVVKVHMKGLCSSGEVLFAVGSMNFVNMCKISLLIKPLNAWGYKSPAGGSKFSLNRWFFCSVTQFDPNCYGFMPLWFYITLNDTDFAGASMKHFWANNKKQVQCYSLKITAAKNSQKCFSLHSFFLFVHFLTYFLFKQNQKWLTSTSVITWFYT